MGTFIKARDFVANENLGQVHTEDEAIGDFVDITESVDSFFQALALGTNLGVCVQGETYKQFTINNTVTTTKCYRIPVKTGEKYRVTCCGSFASGPIWFNPNSITPVSNSSLKCLHTYGISNGNGTFNKYEFTINENGYIYIYGANSESSAFVAGFEAKIEKWM